MSGTLRRAAPGAAATLGNVDEERTCTPLTPRLGKWSIANHEGASRLAPGSHEMRPDTQRSRTPRRSRSRLTSDGIEAVRATSYDDEFFIQPLQSGRARPARVVEDQPRKVEALRMTAGCGPDGRRSRAAKADGRGRRLRVSARSRPDDLPARARREAPRKPRASQRSTVATATRSLTPAAGQSGPETAHDASRPSSPCRSGATIHPPAKQAAAAVSLRQHEQRHRAAPGRPSSRADRCFVPRCERSTNRAETNQARDGERCRR